MRVFLIAGKSGIGKDECALLIKRYYENKNEKTIITKFSKYIKLYAEEIINWNGVEDTKPRKFLQDIGQKMRVDLNKPRIFIDRMIDDLDIYKDYCDNVVICDVRLIDEIEIFKKEVSDVVTIHLVGDKCRKSLTLEEKNHITETELLNPGT